MNEQSNKLATGIENYLSMKAEIETRRAYLYKEYEQLIGREVGSSDYEILDLFKMNEKVGDFLLSLIKCAIYAEEEVFYYEVGKKINKKIQNLLESGVVGDITSYADVEQVKLSLQSYSFKMQLDNLIGLKLGEPERDKILYLFKDLSKRIDRALIEKGRNEGVNRQLRLIKPF